MIFQRIRTSIVKEPYSFVIFQGRGSGAPAPSLDPLIEFSYTLKQRQSDIRLTATFSGYQELLCRILHVARVHHIFFHRCKRDKVHYSIRVI